MSKFKVGDRVVVVGIPGENGKRGEVTKTDVRAHWPIEIKFGTTGLGLATEDELEFEHIYDALSSLAVEVDSRPAEVQGESASEDVVNHPSHYTSHPSGIECIQVTEHMNFNLGNATKYVWRAGLKSDDPIQDLKKARWYIEREIQRLGGSV